MHPPGVFPHRLPSCRKPPAVPRPRRGFRSVLGSCRLGAAACLLIATVLGQTLADAALADETLAGNASQPAAGPGSAGPGKTGQRETGQPETGLEVTLRVLGEVQDPQVQQDLLSGMLRGLEGRRAVRMPAAWPAVHAHLRESPRAEVRRQALQLALLFDDPRAFETLRVQVVDPSQPADERREAIELLAARKDRLLPGLAMRVLADEGVQRAALRSLAEFNQPGTAEAILRRYPQFGPEARQDALQTLAARSDWAGQLLDAVEQGRVPRSDLHAYTVRQIDSLGDAGLRRRLEKTWGRVSSTSADKRRLIADYSRHLTAAQLRQADLPAGRVLFQKTCANCHTLFGEGGKIGPDITGSQRTNLQYLLENIVDPGAAVAKDYQMQVLVTSSGRIITGLVVADDDASVTVQTVNEKLVLPRDEIDQQRQSPLSLMPEGLLQKLSEREVRDLIGYLSSSRPVALPETSPPSSASTNDVP